MLLQYHNSSKYIQHEDDFVHITGFIWTPNRLIFSRQPENEIYGSQIM